MKQGWPLKIHSTPKNARSDDPHEQHENHAHGEGVEHQREQDSKASLIGSVERIQLVHFVLPTFDAEQRAAGVSFAAPSPTRSPSHFVQR